MNGNMHIYRVTCFWLMVTVYQYRQEMENIAGIDRNCRLIKGQVFLWKDKQDWQDLWDVDGVITPP